MSKRSKTSVKKRLLLLVIAVVLLAVASPFLYRHFHKKVSVIPTTKTTTPNTSGQNSTPTSNTPTTSPKTSTSGGSSSTTAALVAPFGTFVSSHHPTSTSQIESVCNTTAGASCHIEFASGNNIKKLADQTVGNDGSTSWVWTVQDAGLTEGSWKITAVATLNGQTKTSTDQVLLEVQK